MASTLTHNQSLTLEFIRHSQEKNGVGPSYQEIADILGLKAKSGAHTIIQALIQRGRIRKIAQTSRQYDIVDQSKEELIDLRRQAAPYVGDQELWVRIREAVDQPNAA